MGKLIMSKPFKKLTFDPLAQAIYIYFSNEPIKKTLEIARNVYIDLDEKGEVVGLELIRKKVQLTTLLSKIPKKYHLPKPSAITKEIKKELIPMFH